MMTNGNGIVNKSFSVAGSVVTWTIAEDSSLATLSATWGAGGFEVPLPVTPDKAMKAAIDRIVQVASGHRKLIRPRDGTEGGYEIFEEWTAKGSDGHDHVERRSLGIGAATDTGGTFLAASGSKTLETAVESQFWAERNILPHNRVALALVHNLEKLGALPLRSTGGVYWVPGKHEATLRLLADGLRQAGKGAVSTLYLLNTALDQDALVAVSAALTAQVEAQVSEINAEIDSGKLGARALKARAEQADRLTSKIAEYETDLGMTLDALREKSTRAQEAAAGAALAAMADDLPSTGGAP
jgi:hypothetical protein